MNDSKWKLQFGLEDFAFYGLNKHRNFLEPSDGYIELEDEEEMSMWMAEVLSEHGCPESAIFAIDENNTMYAGITHLNEDSSEMIIDILRCEEFDLEWFAELDADLRLCCYALIVEVDFGKWIVKEY